MTNKNYITRGVGYIALLAAIIEQANADLKVEEERLAWLMENRGYDTECCGNAIKCIKNDIKAWQNIVEEDINFKIYE